jgi:hypothetical protein
MSKQETFMASSEARAVLDAQKARKDKLGTIYDSTMPSHTPGHYSIHRREVSALRMANYNELVRVELAARETARKTPAFQSIIDDREAFWGPGGPARYILEATQLVQLFGSKPQEDMTI